MSRHLSKKEFLEKLQEVSLMGIDLALFLDTHPDCLEALNDYKQVVQLYGKLKTEYNQEFGPLFLPDLETESTYSWVNDPWPWERIR